MTEKNLTFNTLISSIQQVHGEMAAQASKAINISLTLRNWIIGCYIAEYELRGADRAEYGDRLITELASQLQAKGMERCDRRELYRYKLFHDTYPQIVESVTPQLLPVDSESLAIVESATPKLVISGKKLVEKLSFTHLAELIKIEDNLKRTFYEVESIKGCWSVRELKRQIGSLYYERSGLCGKAALECAGKPKARLRFLTSFKSGVARWLPPHSKTSCQSNEARCLVYTR